MTLMWKISEIFRFVSFVQEILTLPYFHSQSINNNAPHKNVQKLEKK
jgi:hypothetical protein